MLGLVMMVAFWRLVPLGRQMSAAQEELLGTLGPPAQFILAYLPQGEDDDMRLARTEIWYYPEHEKKITFISGEILAAEDYAPLAAEKYSTSLHPRDFDFKMDAEAVAEAIGNDAIDEIDLVPELLGDVGVQTYMADGVIFSIEAGHLTFLQTYALEEE